MPNGDSRHETLSQQTKRLEEAFNRERKRYDELRKENTALEENNKALRRVIRIVKGDK